MEAVKLCREQDFDVIILDIMDAGAGRLFNLPGDPQETKNIPVINAVGTRRRGMIRFTDLNLELTIVW